MSNPSCGPINPLAGLATTFSSLGSSVQDVKSFVSPSMALDPQAAKSLSAASAFHPSVSSAAPVHSSARHFLQSFHGSGAPAISQPLIQIHPSHQFHARPAPALSADPLIDQFHQLEIAHKQAAHAAEEFERAFHMGNQTQTQPNWASEFPINAGPAAMIHQPQSHSHSHALHRPVHYNQSYYPQQSMYRPYNTQMSAMPRYPTQQYAPPPMQHYQPQAAPEVVDEKASTATKAAEEWVNEFSSQESQDLPQSSSVGPGGGVDREMLEKLMNSDQPKFKNSKFLKFIQKVSNGEIEFGDGQIIERGPIAAPTAGRETEAEAAEAAQKWAEDYGMGNDAAEAARLGLGADAESWDEEFQTNAPHMKSFDDWQRQFEREQAELEAALASGKTEEEWASEFKAREGADGEMDYMNYNWQEVLQQAKSAAPAERADPEYQFAAENPFMQHSNAFEEGVRLLEAGKLKESIMAFEAAVQQNADHSDAWCYLGQAQAENEEESNAIAALLKSIAVDPYNLKALMMLGVSYTNDLEEHRALNYLKTWIQNNPDYQHGALASQSQNVEEYLQFYGGASNPMTGMFDGQLHDQVTKLYLDAVAAHPRDAELHTVLGVLYHISSDYEKAIECFKNALKLRPNDAQLWNKLGATQANASRPQEAVHAYQRALQLRPGYVRAQANLAISYANQNMHDEAVRAYLRTLQHNPDANHIWSYLKISLSHVGREDLVELANQKNVELFRSQFPF